MGSLCHVGDYEDCHARDGDYGSFKLSTTNLKPRLLELANLRAPATATAEGEVRGVLSERRASPAHVLGEQGDNESAPALANRILTNSRIGLATVHPSGVPDQANARQNLLDTSAGQAARRSSYGNAPGGTVLLDVRLLGGLLALAESFSFHVTEVCGGSHSPNSRHYAGIAADVDAINGRPVDANHPDVRPFQQMCRNLGATEVLGPGDPGHATHVHTAWPRHA